MLSKPLSPDVALRRFLDVVADEATLNSAFRNRLLFAIGAPIMFEGSEDIATISPVEIAVRYEEDAFKRIYGTLKAPALKKLLVSFNLATTTDVGAKGMKVPEFIELLWTRARSRAEEDGRL